jgi:hypothetical protein
MNKIKFLMGSFFVLLFTWSCAAIKPGESWKMLPEDNTIGFTLLWELPEEKILQMLPPNQLPRIQNGKGVLMLFLASTDKYYIGKTSYKSLGIAHLIIPLKNSIALPETVGQKKSKIIAGLNQIGFPVHFGDVDLSIQENSDGVEMKGRIEFEKGSLTFSGASFNEKGKEVNLPLTTLVGQQYDRNYLSGPEFYRPIVFESIQIESTGENWINKFDLPNVPNRIWLNVDFGVDFKYLPKMPN